jgi:TRAP-type C4-dicarboxylate transport system permease small subunit
MRRITDWLAIAAGWSLVVYCVAVGVEIIGRRYLGFSLQGVDEIGGYLMAVIVAIGFSGALYSHAHIRIDLLLPRLSRQAALWLNVAAVASIVAFAVFLLWQGVRVLMQSHALHAVAPTPLLTPLVIPETIWVITLLYFVLSAAAFFVKVLVHALSGEAQQVAGLLGTSAGRTDEGSGRTDELGGLTGEGDGRLARRSQ